MLHQSRTGPRGQPNDVVGINWKAPTRSHPSPSLVVTCAHQVVVYKVSPSLVCASLSVVATSCHPERCPLGPLVTRGLLQYNISFAAVSISVV